VLGTAYGIASGVVVDTHVLRSFEPSGFVANEDPKKVEQDLMKIIPQESDQFSHQLICTTPGLHARKPMRRVATWNRCATRKDKTI